MTAPEPRQDTIYGSCRWRGNASRSRFSRLSSTRYWASFLRTENGSLMLRTKPADTKYTSEAFQDPAENGRYRPAAVAGRGGARKARKFATSVRIENSCPSI